MLTTVHEAIVIMFGFDEMEYLEETHMSKDLVSYLRFFLLLIIIGVHCNIYIIFI